LWQGANIISVSLSGHLNFLNSNYNAPTAEQIIKTVKGHTKSITALEVVKTNGQQKIYSASHDGTVIAWSSDTGIMHTVRGHVHTNSVSAIAFNQQNHIASCGLDDTVRFLDVSSNQYVYASSMRNL
jgi:WD40 repeat protein